MKLHLASAAITAAMIAALPANAATMTYGDTHAASCAKAAMAETSGDSVSEPAHRGALQDCTAALADKLLPADRTATLLNRGIVNAAAGHAEAAQADYDAALARAPEMANAYLNRGTAMLRNGRFDAARADFDRALALKTDQAAIATFSRGMANEKLGDLTAAYRDYRQAQTLAPDFAPARVELARFQVHDARYANR
jgi:tetratricopeptide (TPR) repeat protein